MPGARPFFFSTFPQWPGDNVSSWSDFKAEKTDFDPVAVVLAKQIPTGKFGTPNDPESESYDPDLPTLADVTDIYLQKARDEVRLDLQEMLGLRIGDGTADAYVDALVTPADSRARVLTMRRLLATKQISLAFVTLSKRETDKYSDDLRFWLREYERRRSADVPALVVPGGAATARVIGVG